MESVDIEQNENENNRNNQNYNISNLNCTKNYIKGLNTLSKSSSNTNNEQYIILFNRAITSFSHIHIPQCDIYNLYDTCKYCIINNNIDHITYISICKHIIDCLFDYSPSSDPVTDPATDPKPKPSRESHPYATQLISLISHILQYKCDGDDNNGDSANTGNSYRNTHMEIIQYISNTNTNTTNITNINNTTNNTKRNKLKHNRCYHSKWIVPLVLMFTDCCKSYRECGVVIEGLLPYINHFHVSGTSNSSNISNSSARVNMEDYSIIYYHMFSMGKTIHQHCNNSSTNTNGSNSSDGNSNSNSGNDNGGGGDEFDSYSSYMMSAIVRLCACLERLMESIPNI